MSKYIDSYKLIAEIDKRLSIFEYGMAYSCWAAFKEIVESLQHEQPECIEKTVRISPGLISNFGTSTYVLDVDLTQDEMAKFAPFGFNSDKIKIKIVCE